MVAQVGSIEIDLLARTAEFQSDLRRATSTIERFAAESRRNVSAASNAFRSLRTTAIGMVGAYVSLQAAASSFNSLLSTNTQYAQLNGALETIEGSADAASAAFDRLREFAKTTPFELDQSVSAYIRLRTLGLDASEKSMRAFGNTASAFGKSMIDYIEAVADASTFEFERLKEFGVKVRQEQDSLRVSFRGNTYEIAKDARAITEFLVGIGETDFAGAMDRQMQGLVGKLSNLSDSFSSLKYEIGEGGFSGAVGDAADRLAGFLQDMMTTNAPRRFGEALGNSIRLGSEAVVKLAEEFAPKLIAGVERASLAIASFANNKDNIDSITNAVAALGDAFAAAGRIINTTGGYLGEFVALSKTLFYPGGIGDRLRAADAATKEFIQPYAKGAMRRATLGLMPESAIDQIFDTSKLYPAPPPDGMSKADRIEYENTVKPPSFLDSVKSQVSAIKDNAIGAIKDALKFDAGGAKSYGYGFSGASTTTATHTGRINKNQAPTVNEIEEIKRAMRMDTSIINEFEQYASAVRNIGQQSIKENISSLTEYQEIINEIKQSAPASTSTQAATASAFPTATTTTKPRSTGYSKSSPSDKLQFDYTNAKQLAVADIQQSQRAYQSAFDSIQSDYADMQLEFRRLTESGVSVRIAEIKRESEKQVEQFRRRAIAFAESENATSQQAQKIWDETEKIVSQIRINSEKEITAALADERERQTEQARQQATEQARIAEELKQQRIESIRASDDFGAGANLYFETMRENMYTLAQSGYEMADRLREAFQSAFSDTLFNVFTGRIDNMRSMLQSFGNSVIRIFSDIVAKIITQKMTLAISEKVFGASAVTAGVAQAAALSTAWSTPAALASLATMGANAGPAMASVTSTIATTRALSAIPAFAEGGVIGSPTLAVIGDNPRASEAVLPLNEQGVGKIVDAFETQGMTGKSDGAKNGKSNVSRPQIININNPVFWNQQEFAATIDRISRVAIYDEIDSDGPLRQMLKMGVD